MSKVATGGLAYPFEEVREYHPDGVPRVFVNHGGMTLRDYFAGQALVELLAWESTRPHPQEVAAMAYAIADEMLTVRKGA